MKNPFIANWTSKGNTLCLGHWEIQYLNTTLILPPERREKDMEHRRFIILLILKTDYI